MVALLFGLNPLDPMTYLGVSGFLTVVAMAAVWIPSRRISHVDLASALRHE
jgi:ABC-type lipoprotein release transport system permease subunit